MSPVPRIQKAAVSDQLPGVTVCFQPQPQQSRFDVIVSTPVGQELNQDLKKALNAIGFKPSADQAPEVNGMLSRSYEGEGYGLGGDWTAAERERYNGQARRMLRRFGYTMVPEIKLPVL